MTSALYLIRRHIFRWRIFLQSKHRPIHRTLHKTGMHRQSMQKGNGKQSLWIEDNALQVQGEIQGWGALCSARSWNFPAMRWVIHFLNVWRDNPTIEPPTFKLMQLLSPVDKCYWSMTIAIYHLQISISKFSPQLDYSSCTLHRKVIELESCTKFERDSINISITTTETSVLMNCMLRVSVCKHTLNF